MEIQSINKNIFYNIDCIKGSKKYIDDNSVDLIITDPPYGIDGDKLHRHYNRNEELVIDGYFEVPKEKYPAFSRQWVAEAERILKPGGCIYIISGYTNLFYILDALKRTNLKEINHIIWKYNFGVFTKCKYVSSHYHILYYEKKGGNRIFNTESRYGLCEKDVEGGSLNYSDREDVWNIKKEYKRGLSKNKNELPIELIKKIVQYSSNENDTICDFFLGGFSTAKVAIGLNRRIIGFEISDEIFSNKIKEIRNLRDGFLLDTTRTPQIFYPENQGKRWTIEERDQLHKRYLEMKSEKYSRLNAIKKLCKEFGRGYWSIEKALKKDQ